MANMVDYLAWRGDVPFEISPWNEVDGLLIATLSYLDFHGGRDPHGWTLEEMARIDLLREGTSSSFAGRKAAFEGMAAGERFRGCRLHHAIAITDPEIEMQFSALCLDLPDGTTCVAFRGTDNTLVGWREDFNMAYTTRVPAQEAAILYLSRAAALSKRPLRLVGHSKGGNLAVYAAALSSKRVQDRIESIWSYDGPGMNREISQAEGYLRAELRQRFKQDGGRADPVRVVIPEDHDPVARGNGIADEADSLVHAGEQEGIVQVLQGGGKEAPGLLFRMDAPQAQQRAEPPGKVSQGREVGGAAGGETGFHSC